MPSQANRALPEGSRLENYTIVRTLGAGGFSFVYLAHDENETPVVIKEYLPSSLAIRTDGSAVPKIAAS
ncbi:MAG TPA: serine/threonine protein kinase, partial [Burkholderiales bacterium]|nr:serine/threonine protein kinase [Burkholderiales bacterium]